MEGVADALGSQSSPAAHDPRHPLRPPVGAEPPLDDEQQGAQQQVALEGELVESHAQPGQ